MGLAAFLHDYAARQIVLVPRSTGQFLPRYSAPNQFVLARYKSAQAEKSLLSVGILCGC
jgi:hypothetical protein